MYFENNAITFSLTSMNIWIGAQIFEFSTLCILKWLAPMPGEPQNHLSLAGKYSNCDIWNFVLRQTLSGQVRPRMPRKPCHPFASQPGSAKLQCKMHPRADRIRTGWRKHVGLRQVLEWDCPERPFLCETH